MQFKHGDIIRLPEKREVLFEKYSKYIVAESFFYENLNGCEIRKTDDNSKYFYFIKNNKCIFEIFFFDEKYIFPNFYCNKDIVWDMLYYYCMNFGETHKFVVSKMKKLYPELDITALFASKQRTEINEAALGLLLKSRNR